MIRSEQITGVVLAGGKSLRFGSNKALNVKGNKTYIQCAVELLRPYTKEVVISGFYPEYKRLKVLILKDDIINIGPLGGIYTALNYSKTSWILVSTCDMPNLAGEVIDYMLADIKDEKVIGWGSDIHIGGFPMLISKEIIFDLQQYINNGQYKIKQLFDKDYARTINIPEEWKFHFSNINKQEDIY